MVVPQVPVSHQKSPLVDLLLAWEPDGAAGAWGIASCCLSQKRLVFPLLPSCSLGNGSWCRGSREVLASHLGNRIVVPSVGKSSILVSTSCLLLPSCSLGTADAGASGPKKSPILVSHHTSPLVSLLVTWEPDAGAEGPGKLRALVSHHNVLLSPFFLYMGTGLCCGESLGNR